MPPLARKAGRPFPSNTRVHRALTGDFADGAVITIAVPIVTQVAVAGDTSVRLYWKATKVGTLEFKFLRPNRVDPYDLEAASDEVTVADAETVVDIACQGESVLEITFTPAATGVITYADVAHGDGI